MKKLAKNWVFILSKALSVFLAFLLGIIVWGSWLANENAPTVSAFLGQPMYKIDYSEAEGGAIDPISGVKDPKYKWYYKNKHDTLADLKKNTTRVGKQIEQEGAALLYNKSGSYDNGTKALPLKVGSKVSFFGTGSIRPLYNGQGSHGVSNYTKNNTYLKAFTEADYEVNTVLWDKYLEMYGDPTNNKLDKDNEYRRNRQSYPNNGTSAYKLGGIYWDDIYTNNEDVKASVQEYGDAAIFCIVRQGGEGIDFYPGEYAQDETFKAQGNDGIDQLKLTKKERSVIKGLTALKKSGKIKRIIVLLNLTNQIGMEFLNDNEIDVDAVVWTGSYGESGIFAIPELLNGNVNFSGSLPFTFYYDNYDIPAMANFYNGEQGTNSYTSLMMHYDNLNDFDKKQDQNTTGYIVYKEGIYVDYRYPETRYEDVVTKREKAGDFKYADTVAYTHGYGLSYTDFEFSNMSIKPVTGSRDYDVSVTVKNVGSRAGMKAVQIYAQKAYGDYDIENKIEKSAVDFVAFDKTDVLEPGQSEVINIRVDGREIFAAYDANNAKTYVVTPGTYYLTVGHNAHDALNNILAAKNKDVSDGMTENGNRNLAASITWKSLDNTTFAKSDATGKLITNLFDESDINKYSGRGNNRVTYTTRNNWEGTVSGYVQGEKHYEVLSATAQMWSDQRKGHDPEESEKSDREYPEFGRNYSENPLTANDGNVISKNLSVVDMLDENGKPFPTDDVRWEYLMNQITWDELSNLVQKGFRHTEAASTIGLMYSAQFNESNGIANQPTWGDTSRGCVPGKALAVAYDDPDKEGMAELWPGNPVITATLNRELAYECGLLWGEEGNWAGLAGLYGPGFNMLRTPYGGRAYEYFGADPYGAGMMGAEIIRGMQEEGCFTVIKHFAFNDSEYYRRCASLWINEQAAREIYLRSFYYPIAEGGALSVMCSMGRIGQELAPSSNSLINGWLRGEAGLKGFATTDVFSSKQNNKTSQIKAGTDLSDDNAFNTYGNFEDYKPGTGHADFAWAMRESGKRIAYTVLSSNAINGYTPGVINIPVIPAWQILLITLKVVVSVLFAASVIFVGVTAFARFKYKENDKEV